MRNIAEIIEDDRNGKQLSQTERRIAVAYIQGKYDAVRELKIVNNSNTDEVLGKMRAEIEQITDTMGVDYNLYISKIDVLRIIDKCKEEGWSRE